MLEVNKSTKSKQHFGSTADLAEVMSAMSVCNSSKGPLKLHKVEKLFIFFCCLTKGIYNDAFTSYFS